jgi:radical SAM superfamily enzyme YgiQ (UPF0313 family)
MGSSRKLTEKADRLLSLERGTVFKEPGGKINICLVYPNTYHVGMSNLGFQGIYTLLNDMPDVLCERAFMPDEEDMAEYERTGAELFCLESKRPIGRFDIIAFSVSFENDYPNIIKILELGRIPFKSKERVRPLVIAGGVVVFSNPEPLSPFFDIMFVGEAEEMLPEFLEAYKKSGSKDELIKKSLSIEGIYAPGLYDVSYGKDGTISGRNANKDAPEKIKRRFVKDISSYRLRPSIVTPETEFSDMYLIEAMRGCPWNCSFCLAGHVFNPPRRKEPEALKKEIAEALRLSKRVGIIGPSLTDYPDIEELLSIEGVDFSITSLRASPKSAALTAIMKGRRSVSIAPEAGTERLRLVINKKITEDDILVTSHLILEGGIETLKLYFMAGLPTETDEDIEGIISLAKKIRESSSKGNITITISTFVPKPFTPFEWHPMERMDVVKDRLKKIKNALSPATGIRVFHDVPKYSYMQGLFAMGDRRAGAVLEEMLETPDWRKASGKAGINPDFYIFRKKDFTETLPWDFIDSGIDKKRLRDVYDEAVGQL